MGEMERMTPRVKAIISFVDKSKRAKYSQRVKDIIRFIELLKVPSGAYAGKNFKLLQFQKDFMIT